MKKLNKTSRWKETRLQKGDENVGIVREFYVALFTNEFRSCDIRGFVYELGALKLLSPICLRLFCCGYARFPHFSCLRSTNGETEESSEKKHRYGTKGFKADQPKLLNCVANARSLESTEVIVAADMSDTGCVLGEGTLGRVYKGILENVQEVAVKKMFDEEADLSKEVKILRSVKHSNIVKMIGYCNKGKDRIIVFELMPSRSLNLHLHDLEPGKEPLDWKTRMKIAEGVAKALEYLRDQNDPPVIYSGLKSTSILLDENYNPKLSDFSCARHGPECNYVVIHSKLVRGGGYIGPEYMKTGVLTLESDVFGFGVVLLELISGQKLVEEYIRGSGKHDLTSWARPLLEDSKKFPEIADPLMNGQYPCRELVQALDLTTRTSQKTPYSRSCDYSFEFRLPNP